MFNDIDDYKPIIDPDTNEWRTRAIAAEKSVVELKAWCKRLERQVVEMDEDYDRLRCELQEATVDGN